MVRIGILLAAVVLDSIVGDPYTLPHPIRWIGSLISWLEKTLRPHFPETKSGERLGGTVEWLLVVLISCFTTSILLILCKRIHFALYLVFSVCISCYMLAGKSLADESGKVYSALKEGDLSKARYAVSMIVGRDTASLDEAGVTRAAVETVAENTSDGVIAPLLFLALLGPVGGVFYKAVNTMDSMLGYHNERYENWGWFPAHMDDWMNFLPARLSGGMMCLAAGMMGFDGSRAWQVFLRDRLNHKSPNSAHTEAACAGALGLLLGGDSFYFGKLVHKPTIGDDVHPIEPGDILRSHRLMYGTLLLTLVLCVAGMLLFDFLKG